MGSNRAKGTGRHLARRRYAVVRTQFGKLAKAAGYSLEGLQVHHTLFELAKYAARALDTTNLSFQRGNAGVVGTGHHYAHEVNKAVDQGAKNPGKHVADRMRAAGVTPDVPELGPSPRTPSEVAVPPVAEPAAGGSMAAVSEANTLVNKQATTAASETKAFVSNETKAAVSAEAKAGATAARREAGPLTRVGGGTLVTGVLEGLNIYFAWDAYKDGTRANTPAPVGNGMSGGSTGEGILNAAGSLAGGGPDLGTALRQSAELGSAAKPEKLLDAVKSGASPVSIGMGIVFGSFR
jgi:hypothetical protein